MLAFKLYDLSKNEVYHPDILKNPKCWDRDDVVIYDDKSHKLLQWKLDNLYNNGEPKIKTTEFTINNQNFLLKEIDFDENNLPEEIKKIQDDIHKNIRDILYSIVKKKLYDDLSYQIVSEIIINRKSGTEIKESDDYEWLFSLPFDTYFKEAHNLIKTGKVTYEELDNIVIKKTSKFYYNEKLPTPYVPLLSRYHIQTPDGNSWHPRLWQLYFLYHEVDYKVNLILSARQMGKTLGSTLVSFQHLMRPDRADILYVVESEEKLEQPFQYFQRGLQKYVKAGIFTLNKSDKTIRCKITGNTLKFMSAGARTGLKSFSAPIVIFDEASFIKSDAFMSTMPLWSKPNGKFYAFTTVDWKAREHNSEWFYELFKSVELGISDTIDTSKAFALKVTIDQNEFITEEEKKIYAYLKKVDLPRYLADYYCTLIGDDALFDKQKLISPVPAEEYKHRNIVHAIIGYDPADREDVAGIILSYVIYENEKLYLVAVEDYSLEKVDYMTQIQKIKTIVDLQQIKGIPTSIIMDYTGVGAGVYLTLSQTIPNVPIYKILYTAGNQVNYSNGIYKVPKFELVDTIKIASQEGVLKIPYDIKELVTQLDTYRKVNGKYMAITGHDDVIEARMNTVFLFYNQIQKRLKLFSNGVYNSETGVQNIILHKPSSTARKRFQKFIY